MGPPAKNKLSHLPGSLPFRTQKNRYPVRHFTPKHIPSSLLSASKLLKEIHFKALHRLLRSGRFLIRYSFFNKPDPACKNPPALQHSINLFSHFIIYKLRQHFNQIFLFRLINVGMILQLIFTQLFLFPGQNPLVNPVKSVYNSTKRFFCKCSAFHFLTLFA